MLRKNATISFLFLATLMLRAAPSHVSASEGLGTLRVPADFSSIQEAVDAASPGDTVLVAPGLYNECVVVDKPLRLVGEDCNRTIIDGGGYGPDRQTRVFSILSENVSIEGFTIRNAYYGIYANHSETLMVKNVFLTSNFVGSWVDGCHGLTFQESLIASNLHGVIVDESSDCIVKGNIFENNWGGVPDLLIGIGLSLSKSNSSVIANNFLAKHEVGAIALEEAYETIVANNTTTENRICGIQVYSSQKNVIINNTSVEDERGIDVTGGSTDNVVAKNSVFQDYAGIGCSSSYGNVFADNTLHSNGRGFILKETSGRFVGNLIINNSNGIELHSSNNSILHHNNFVNNTFDIPEDAYVNLNVWDDGFEGNYWDRYNGTDVNQDGIGDSPQVIDRYNMDNHPLMGQFSNFTFQWQEQEHFITAISNSTITDFRFDSTLKMVSFNVTGETPATGFCRIAIQKLTVEEIWNNNYTVLVDNKQPLTLRNWTEEATTFIYFTYQHPERRITIIPELPLGSLMPILVLTTTMAIIKKRQKSNNHSHRKVESTGLAANDGHPRLDILVNFESYEF